MHYTGIGSRKTPLEILELMEKIAEKLDNDGYILRSGGADGADTAFECRTNRKEIFVAAHCTKESMAIAAQFHPAWNRCKLFARKLHGRNSFQVLGADLKTPSKFVICWTQDGAISHSERSIRTGGTGTAISIASHYGVPVFNLRRPDHLERLQKFVQK
jgi:hypothetical protein